ncbi:uncharacterized protein LOC144584514 [Pogona vitticeps]
MRGLPKATRLLPSRGLPTPPTGRTAGRPRPSLTCGGGGRRSGREAAAQAAEAALQAVGAAGELPQAALQLGQQRRGVAAQVGQLPEQRQRRQPARLVEPGQRQRRQARGPRGRRRGQQPAGLHRPLPEGHGTLDGLWDGPKPRGLSGNSVRPFGGGPRSGSGPSPASSAGAAFSPRDGRSLASTGRARGGGGGGRGRGGRSGDANPEGAGGAPLNFAAARRARAEECWPRTGGRGEQRATERRPSGRGHRSRARSGPSLAPRPPPARPLRSKAVPRQSSRESPVEHRAEGLRDGPPSDF